MCVKFVAEISDGLTVRERYNVGQEYILLSSSSSRDALPSGMTLPRRVVSTTS